MRKGYERIGTNEPGNGPNRKIWITVFLAVAVLLALSVNITRMWPQSVVPAEEESTTRYRPLCLVHNKKHKVQVIQTSMASQSQPWTRTPCIQSSLVEANEYEAPDAVLRTNFSFHAHPSTSTILGFGGAFTEASALNFERLSKEGQETALDLLFGKDGLGYSIGRFPINSCDFSVDSYTFDDVEDDFELKHFDVGVHHDVESGMVDMALRAASKLKKEWPNDGDGSMFLYASPWSPPAWMKKPTWEDDKGASHAAKMTYSAPNTCLREGTKSDSRYAAAWALYFSKFLTAYANLGLPLDAVTVQNEPEFAAPWEACSYDKEHQAEFVANHLGPILEKNHPETKILIFDHNKDHMLDWTDYILSSPAQKYVAGTAYHWYAGGMDRLLDGALGTPNIHQLSHSLKAKHNVSENYLLFNSEACHCPSTGYAGGLKDIYWARAERYAHVILADFAAGSTGWVEWNLILDSIGGPNHLGNLCESTILAAPHRAKDAPKHSEVLPKFERHKPKNLSSIVGDGQTREELNAAGFPAKYLDVGLVVQPLYFYMGHISKFVRPGSISVGGLFDTNSGPGRPFRAVDSVVAGGGENNLARNGIELTVWPCEGSTRQQFRWNFDHHKRLIVFGHDWLGNPTRSCVSKQPDKDFGGLRLQDCDSTAGAFDMIPDTNDEYGRFYIKLINHDSDHDVCLVIKELENGGGSLGERGGAQVTTGSCEDESAKWALESETGEAASYFFENGDIDINKAVCITTGWPFLQMGAFETPTATHGRVVVVLNEANDPANFELQDEDGVLMTSSIPSRSIQTILID